MVQGRAGELCAPPLAQEAARLLGYGDRYELMADFYQAARVIDRSVDFMLTSIAGPQPSPLSAIDEKIKSGARLNAFEHIVLEGVEHDHLNTVKRFWVFLRAPLMELPTPEILTELGFWPIVEKVFPQLWNLAFLAPADPVHIYTVGAHSGLTLLHLKYLASQVLTLADGEESDRALNDDLDFNLDRLAEIKNFDLLLLAALLHDVGKSGPPGDHSRRGAEMVPTLAASLGLDEEDGREAALLVGMHLLLADTATRRDLSDEELIAKIAAQVGNLQNLSRLYLLTMADSLATAPEMWRRHRVALIRDLFFKLKAFFTKGQAADLPVLDTNWWASEIMALVESDAQVAPDLLSEFLNLLPLDYYHYQRPKKVLVHYKMWLEFSKSGRPLSWRIDGQGGALRTLTVLTRNRHGLLAILSGAVAWAGLNILGAQVFCPSDNLALDVFTLSPPPHDEFREARIWQRLGRGLELSLEGQKLTAHPGLASQSRIAPTVTVDQESVSHSTIVEVRAPDRPGLLHDLAAAIFEVGLSIEVAKVDTIGSRAIDVFYLRDKNGQKIDNPVIIKRLAEALAQVGLG